MGAHGTALPAPPAPPALPAPSPRSLVGRKASVGDGVVCGLAAILRRLTTLGLEQRLAVRRIYTS